MRIRFSLPKIRVSTPGWFQKSRVGSYLTEVLGNKEIRQRLLFTLIIIAVLRLLASIPLPGIDMAVYQSQFATRSASEVTYFLTIFTGGLLDSPSIVGLGIGVYITSSIIIQLLTSVIPQLEELSKEGARGKQLIDQYTRYLTIPLSLLYSLGYLYLLSQQNLSTTGGQAFLIPRDATGNIPATKLLFMALVLTAGSMLVMWLAELVTERGIGNGASLVIMVGILASMPALVQADLASVNLAEALNQLFQGNTSYLNDPGMLALYLLVFGGLAIIAGIIFMTESTRKVPIQYASRERQGGNTRDSFLPLKLNQSGVLPIIFASALLTTPRLLLPLLVSITDINSPVGQFFNNAQNSNFFVNGTTENTVIYFLFIIAFSLFYAFVALKPADVAEDLQKRGAFIPGIRPGKSTESYIIQVMLKLTFVGALFLGVIAMVPLWSGTVLTNLTGQSFLIFTAIGGTSVLIVVGVALETVRKVNSYRATQNYDKYI